MTPKIYGLFIFLLKASIIATTAGFALNFALMYFGVEKFLLSYFLGIGILTWLFQLIASVVLRLGRPHIYCLWTIFVINLIDIADFEIGLPLDTTSYCVMETAFLLLMLVGIGCDRFATKPRPVKSPSKYGGKLMVTALKTFPVIIAAGIAARYPLSLFSTLADNDFYSIFFGCSFVCILFMYVASIVFRFCSYHRFCIIYILLSHTLALLDWYYLIPESWINTVIISMTIASLIIFIALYIHVNYHQKTAQPDARRH